MKLLKLNEYGGKYYKQEIVGNKVADDIKKVFYKHFPLSYISVNGMPDSDSFTIEFTLASEDDGYYMNQQINDMMYHMFFIGSNGEYLKNNRGAGFKIDGFKHKKVPFKAYSGGKDAVKKFEEYLIRLKKSIHDNMDQLRDEDLELYNSKLK